MAADALARSTTDHEPYYRPSLAQVDEIEHLCRRIQLRATLIDDTFLQGGHRQLTDAFTSELAGGFTVAEAIQALLEDIGEAAAGIEKIMTAANPARLEPLAVES